MSKKIIYVGGFEMPDRNAAANRVKNIGNIYSKLGYDVVYIGVNEKENLSPQKLTENQIYYSLKYPSSNGEWIHYLFDAKPIIGIVDDITDVVAIICYDLQSPIMYKLKRYCKKRGIKLLSDITEWTNTTGSFVKRIIKGIDTSVRMRCLNKSCDGLIVISDYLSDYYKNTRHIKVPVLTDPDDFLGSNYQKHDYIQLIYAGFSSKSKDRLDYIIRSLSELFKIDKRIKLVIVGTTKEQFLDTYPEVKSIKDIDMFVHFMGRLTHTETVSLLIQSDYSIFIRSNNKKCQAGFPTKFAESISAGVPVITNYNYNLKSFLKDGENGYLINGRYPQMYRDLCLIVENHQSNYLAMRERCTNNTSFHYSSYVKLMSIFNNEIGI